MSQTELELEAVNAAILKILSGQVAEYQIKGRQATYLDLSQLRELRSELRIRLQREQAAENGTSRNIGISWRCP
jgi:hypothetical protein